MIACLRVGYRVNLFTDVNNLHYLVMDLFMMS